MIEKVTLIYNVMKISLTINQNTYSIPAGWNNITISQYQQIEKLKELPENQFILHLVALLLNSTPQEISKLSPQQFAELTSLLTWVNEDKPACQLPPATIRVNGVSYGLDDLSKISMGMYLDLDARLQADNSSDYLADIIACLYRPIINKQPFYRRWLNRLKGNAYRDFIIEDYDSISRAKRAKEFQSVDMSIVFDVLFFFALIGQECMIVSQPYLTQMMNQKKQK